MTEHTLEKWKKEEKDKFVSLVVVVVVVKRQTLIQVNTL